MLPARQLLCACGRLLPPTSSTRKHAEEVGMAIATLRLVVQRSPSPSAPQTLRALDLIDLELRATRTLMVQNDRRLTVLQLDLMRLFEQTQKEIAKIKKKRGTTPVMRSAVE